MLAGRSGDVMQLSFDTLWGPRRSSIPCMTALLAVVVEGKVPSRFEAVALAVLCAGVMLTVWEGLAGSAAGVLLCLAGTVRPSIWPLHAPDV